MLEPVLYSRQSIDKKIVTLKELHFQRNTSSKLKNRHPKGIYDRLSLPDVSTPMNKMAQENSQPDPFIYMDDSSMNSQDDSHTSWSQEMEEAPRMHLIHRNPAQRVGGSV